MKFIIAIFNKFPNQPKLRERLSEWYDEMKYSENGRKLINRHHETDVHQKEKSDRDHDTGIEEYRLHRHIQRRLESPQVRITNSIIDISLKMTDPVKDTGTTEKLQNGTEPDLGEELQ